MKFTYRYKTSANETRGGVLSASSRDEVFRTLRKDGIRPFQVDLAPGIANRVLALGKRGLAIAVLVVACGALGIVAARALRTSHSALRTFDATARRQVIGDSAVIDMGIRTGWADVFDDEGERFLASFAIPGVEAGLRQTSVAALEGALKRRCDPVPSDRLEARQIKSMVEGMKDELRRYLASGGTVAQYGQRLVERQEAELRYYRLAQGDLNALAAKGASQQEILIRWEKLNAELRHMGVRLLPLPAGHEKAPPR